MSNKDYDEKIPFTKRCYTRWSMGPTEYIEEGYERLYELYGEKIIEKYNNETKR